MESSAEPYVECAKQFPNYEPLVCQLREGHTCEHYSYDDEVGWWVDESGKAHWTSYEDQGVNE